VVQEEQEEDEDLSSESEDEERDDEELLDWKRPLETPMGASVYFACRFVARNCHCAEIVLARDIV
jgi:hypothetical protein